MHARITNVQLLLSCCYSVVSVSNCLHLQGGGNGAGGAGGPRGGKRTGRGGGGDEEAGGGEGGGLGPLTTDQLRQLHQWLALAAAFSVVVPPLALHALMVGLVL